MEQTEIIIETMVDKESDLYKKCKEFWKYWIPLHKDEWSRIARGLPQFENKLETEQKKQV